MDTKIVDFPLPSIHSDNFELRFTFQICSLPLGGVESMKVGVLWPDTLFTSFQYSLIVFDLWKLSHETVSVSQLVYIFCQNTC